MQYIFIHGLGQTEKSWDCFISKFKKSNVHCPSLASMLKTPDVTYEKMYQCFKEYCNGFSEPLNLCGLSLGGILALNYAIDFPNQVNTLVLIGIQYKMPVTLLKLQNIVFHCLPKSMFSSMGFAKCDFIRLTNSMAQLDFSDSLSGVVCQTLVVCGAQDNANQKAATELSQTLKNSKLVLIENAKHEVNVENHECLLQTLNRFYDERDVCV